MLRERLEVEKLEVFPDGTLNVHRVLVLTRDGKELARVPEIEKFSPGQKIQTEDKLLKAVAYAIWSATDINKSRTVPGFKRGKLYHNKGKEVETKPTLVGPSGEPKPETIIDKKAVTIKHRGAEQRGFASPYVGTAQGFKPEPERKIKHRGKEQR